MNSLRFGRPVVGALVAMAMAAGCGGVGTTSSLLTGLGFHGAVGSDRQRSNTNARHDLLYVSVENVGANVFTYPKSKLVQIINGFTEVVEGECVDAAQHVYIVDEGQDEVVEYAHGRMKPIRTLHLPQGETPYSCAVDATTGDLAVTNYYNGGETGYHYNSILIYRGAKGKPIGYYDAGLGDVEFCGYDSNGSLFVDGSRLDELPRGAKALQDISISGGTIHSPGGVQWDGKYLAVGDLKCDGTKGSTCIYQIRVSGSTGTIENTVTLAEAVAVLQFWVQGSTLIAPDSESSCGGTEWGCVRYYNYPKGGSPTKAFQVNEAFGATISAAPSTTHTR